MRYKSMFKPLILMCILLICTTVPGVMAAWEYSGGPPETSVSPMNVSLNHFRYGTLYITRATIKDGSYNNASVAQVGDLNISADLKLKNNSSSSVVVEVTFYNNTDTSFYYNKTETISSNNSNIGFTVTGIETKDEIAPRQFKTIEVTFKHAGNTYSKTELLSELHFNFVVDKDDITSIVAQTAVDRFRDILNNIVAPDSYQTLENAMNNRSGFNKASAVTYIGNVSGSSSTDSKVIESLFGSEFMSMDLDGDGKAEPITIMIKRENIDNNAATGDSYTYTNWGRETTVKGADMTLYITAENLSNVSNGKSVVVYAAAYTKLEGADMWTDLVPLTKGDADANNYSGYGSANSFNTDTWLSDKGKSIEELTA